MYYSFFDATCRYFGYVIDLTFGLVTSQSRTHTTYFREYKNTNSKQHYGCCNEIKNSYKIYNAKKLAHPGCV